MSLNLELSDSLLASLGALQTLVTQTEEVASGLCGVPCANTCNICVQAEADLTAFYAPSAVEVQVMAPAADASQNSALEAAREMDAIEEAQRSGEAFDYDAADDDEYRGCQCLDCLNHDDPDYISYYDDRQDDGDCGLGWNESGYFD